MITKITQNDLDLHARWLSGESDGVQLVTTTGAVQIDVDLRGVDLRDADLRGADLRDVDLSDVDLSGVDLSGADMRDVDLSGVDMRGADMRGANLSNTSLRNTDLIGADMSGADLRGANLDYAVWPLWCGSKGVTVDRHIAAQLVAHVCAVDCDDPDYQALRKLMLPFAKTSHRARELGLLDEEEQ